MRKLHRGGAIAALFLLFDTNFAVIARPRPGDPVRRGLSNRAQALPEVKDINFAWRVRWPKDEGVVMVPAG